MGDLLESFMDELRRRQRAASGQPPHEPRYVGGDGADDPLNAADRGPRGPRGMGSRGGGGRGGGGRSAGGPRDGARPSGLRKYAVVWIALLVLLAILFFGRGLVDLWTDILWYRSVGYEQVLLTRLGAQLGLFVLGGLLALVALLGNLWLAGRLAIPPSAGSGGAIRGIVDRLTEAARTASEQGGASPWSNGPRYQRPVGGDAEVAELPDLVPVGRWILGGFAVLAVLGAAGAISGAWETILLWQNRVPFAGAGAAVTDPIFHRDIGFFMFELPFLRLVQSFIVGLLITTLIVVIGRYFLAAMARGLDLSRSVRLHVAILGGLLLIAMAFGYQLDKLELAYSGRGIGGGVGYTDANAQFFAYDLLTIVSALAGVILVITALTRRVGLLVATAAVWIFASIIIGRVYPEAIQRLVVDPNQYAKESPYIANNIAMTRLAFGFADGGGNPVWDASRRYEGVTPLTQAAIEKEKTTFDNARLWDYRPLGNTLGQLQTIRRYYEFFDVDTDRYQIANAERQVMLSARELDLGGNPNATGFVNKRVIFTHGIGVAMVPVNEVTPEGQPELFIRNLPPASTSGAPTVTEPRIYFGERPSDYVVVGAKQAEFDYPRGDANPGATDTGGVETRWSGTNGIKLDSAITRFLFAFRFGDLDLLISDQVTPNSQLLFHRTLSDRVPRIAPFLRYDKDPYVVVNGAGRLVYIWDAYTITDRFPHANDFSPSDLGDTTGLAGSPFNYIRNSVKVTVDAYDGTVNYYVADPADPLIRAWQGVFPTMFKPMSAMPPDLAAHIRVPEEGFNVQTQMYGRYHVTDPLTFFQNDDLWTVPESKATEQTLPSQAYYVIMRMPGEAKPEFLLLQPMVPTNRPNMIAWVAARNDAPNYGKVVAYRFPTDTTVFGPAQIEARIDQDPVISAQFTLWSQSGSSVIRGNLIVVPVGDSLLYLQPVYLQSTASKFPEFQRIIVASATKVVWAPTLSESLRLLLQAQGSPTPSPTPTPPPGSSPPPTSSPGVTPAPTPGGGSALPGDVPGLIGYANTHFDLAQQALRNGDFARYGQEIALVKQALQRLDQLSGAGASPSAAP
ncbi:MAG TPA: UPF0182 family protein [Candidatus Limnocylindrales bacterium]